MWVSFRPNGQNLVGGRIFWSLIQPTPKWEPVEGKPGMYRQVNYRVPSNTMTDEELELYWKNYFRKRSDVRS